MQLTVKSEIFRYKVRKRTASKMLFLNIFSREMEKEPEILSSLIFGGCTRFLINMWLIIKKCYILVILD